MTNPLIVNLLIIYQIYEFLSNKQKSLKAFKDFERLNLNNFLLNKLLDKYLNLILI